MAAADLDAQLREELGKLDPHMACHWYALEELPLSPEPKA